MIWDIIIDKLVAADLATPGTNLFINEMAPDVSVGIMLKSPLQGIDVDHYLPNYYTPNLQAIIRHTDPVDGDILANRVIAALRVEQPEHYPPTTERGKAKINLFLPRHLPIRFPRLDGKTIEWSVNFQTSFTFEPLPG